MYRELTNVDGEWLREVLPDEVREFDGRLWQVLPDDSQSDVIHLGTAPKPTTVWRTFVYHVCHGLIMQYPLSDVLLWSWRNRTSFTDPQVGDALSTDYK